MVYLFHIFAFLFSILILVLVHEFGHFIIARSLKVKVERFSIGFGKPFYEWKDKNGGTKYVIAPILLGGYVKLLDTRETATTVSNWHLAYDHKPILQRLAIIIAGPFANIVFALFVFWLMFFIGFEVPKPIIGKVIPNSIASHAGMRSGEEIVSIDQRYTNDWEEVAIAMLARVGGVGSFNITTQPTPMVEAKTYQLDLTNWKIDTYEPNPLLDFGIIRYAPQVVPIINKVKNNSPAAKSGLQKGDCIIEVEGKKVNNWEDFVRLIEIYPEKQVKVSLERNKKIENLIVKTGWKFGAKWKKIGFLGITPLHVEWPEQALRYYKYTVWSAFGGALHKMWLFIDLNNILMSKLVTGKLSLHVLGGPVSIFVASGQSLGQGFVVFLSFLATISLAIALINLLPLPGLDGGYVVLLLIEAIIRRPISMRVQMLILRLGIALFVVLISQAMLNDLMRIF